MSQLPIGYWLKHLDRLIENDFDRILAAESLGRRHWQVLHSRHGGGARVAALDERLAPFLDEEEATVAPVAEQLRERGWVQGQGSLSLTEAGTRAHGELFARVEQSRRRLSEGISEQEYRAAVNVLERMSANLENR
ncbi:MarR family winged helix-turn-helix transcriptional regulator [Nocardiopsis salina]|uniref:MarR family winged helix-turn-helix transcriptional regulator n=1 Tax=Nocardiopsis salina TaxID=245836 RepID=UPI00036159A1|nr:MarR family transcriptional regulator [Nocardiopsis salina]